MKKRNFLNLFAMLLLISMPILADAIKVVTPNGTPTMAIAKLIMDNKDNNKYEFTVVDTPENLPITVIKNNVELAIVPSNLPAIFKSKNKDYKIVGVVSWGALDVVSTEDIKDINDLKGKTIYTLGRGLTPDVVLRNLLKKNNLTDKVTVEYASGAQELVTLFMSGKATTISAPSFATAKILSKKANAKKIFSLNDEWKKIYASENGYPQAVLVVRNDYYENNKEALEKFIEDLKSSIAFINSDAKERVEVAKASGLKIDYSLFDEIVKGANIKYTAINEGNSQEIYNEYFKALFEMNSKTVGGRLPTNEIYLSK